MARPSAPVGGGGVSRPSGPVGGGNISRPSGPVGGGGSINRSPSISNPIANAPSLGNRPAIQPGGPGPNRPGVVNPPNLSPGNRPGIDVGQRPSVAPKHPIAPGTGPGNIGRPGTPAIGKSPSVLPGLGIGAGSGLAVSKAGDYLGRRQGNVQDRMQNVSNRSDNLKNRLEQRQDFLGQAQDKRQDFLNDRREDWQNWHDDYYSHHNGWHHGAWCDHWGDYWSHMWSDHTAAMVLGTTMWGLNRMSYWFGTSAYSNPYYTEPLVVDNTTISYAEPLAVPVAPASGSPPQGGEQLPPGVTAEGLKQFDAARAAFYSGDYATALTATNKALASMPADAMIHEFRALILFAQGKYRDAASTLHPVLAVGPGWDFTTMSSLYADVDTYTKQLRALETFVKENPKSADARFVLGYHYLTCGHQKEAAEQLAGVQKLVPNDSVTAQLLQMMGKSGAPPTTPPESKVQIDAAQMVGVWSASRGKASFEMTLGKDNTFTWIYREGAKKEAVSGAFAIDGNVLALEPDAGGVMVAEVTPPMNGAFEFRTVGAPASDSGLRFQKK
jgi:TolA-binding protein